MLYIKLDNNKKIHSRFAHKFCYHRAFFLLFFYLPFFLDFSLYINFLSNTFNTSDWNVKISTALDIFNNCSPCSGLVQCAKPEDDWTTGPRKGGTQNTCNTIATQQQQYCNTTVFTIFLETNPHLGSWTN